MSLQSNATFNVTLYNDPSLCTIKTCPIDWATIQYVPSLAGNAFYLAFFVVILLSQSYLGARYRTWSFMVALLGGEILEVIGYAGRIKLHDNIFVFDSFLIAGIYLCLSRIIITYGEYLARFKPRTYTIIFICCDVFSLVLQSAGGAMASGAADGDDTGINIMIAGLSFQVASLAIFMLLCADFARCVKMGSPAYFLKTRESMARLNSSAAKVKFFIGAELKGGFDGKLANQEVTFMILEGAMVAIASIALTVAHPGLIFGPFWRLPRAREAVRGSDQSGPPAENGKNVFALNTSELDEHAAPHGALQDRRV
ncbi:MAG: hypothetical protein Q9195_009327 [Heterodermia aff. obscurata]